VLPSPSLLGTHGWRAVLPLSAKCAAFVIGVTVTVEMFESPLRLQEESISQA
jgi:hypothetical protein